MVLHNLVLSYVVLCFYLTRHHAVVERVLNRRDSNVKCARCLQPQELDEALESDESVEAEGGRVTSREIVRDKAILSLGVSAGIILLLHFVCCQYFMLQG